MNKVAIISPFGGDTDLNTQYALACMDDCIDRDEAPFAGHVLYPLILDDDEPDERETGIAAGREWMLAADIVAVYSDFGISHGMMADMDFARANNLVLNYRTLPAATLDAIRGK